MKRTHSLGRQVIFEDVPGGTWTAVMRCERCGANLQLRQQRLYALLGAMEGAPGAVKAGYKADDDGLWRLSDSAEAVDRSQVLSSSSLIKIEEQFCKDIDQV